MAKTKGTLDFSEGENPLPAGKKYLLGIGINAYAHCPQLHNAVRDVEDFAALMHEKFGFDPEPPYTQMLRNEEATYENIEEALLRLTEKVVATDTVLIYFSGHGELHPHLGGYWVPVEAKSGSRKDYLSNDVIQRLLQRIHSFHTLLLVDSCYSGSLFLDGKGKFVSDSYDFPSRWGLSSGRDTIVSDGRPGENSPFASALLDTLRRLEQPMNVGALCDIVKQYVPAATQKRQKPIGDPLSMEGHKGGQLVFVPQAKPLDPDAAAWAAAEAENTETAYSRYLRQFPRGRFTEKAEAALELLEQDRADRAEDACWAEAQSKNTLLAYHRYLRQYPKGRYAPEADRHLDALEHEAETQKNLAEEAARKKREQEAAEQKRIAEEAARKKREQEAARPKNGTIFQDAPNLPKMVFVQGGSFKMGSDQYTNEKPIHEVAVPDFYIGQYPVTFEEYDAFCAATKKEKPGDEGWGRGKHPVINISWDDAKAYCEWLSGLTKKTYRLPSEAEWEYAARGGTLSKGFKYAGSNDLKEVGWYWENSGEKPLSGEWKRETVIANKCRTHPVGEKKPNELGLYDMSGNVWEWCEDDWHGDYNNAPRDGKAWIDREGRGDYRVIRGGSWINVARHCRVAFRDYGAPSLRHYYLGFRLVRPS